MLIHILKQRMMKCTWRSEGSSELRRSSETTTLATGCESAEAAAACHALETTGGHFIIHTDLSAFAVSTAVLLSLWESSIFCFLRFFVSGDGGDLSEEESMTELDWVVRLGSGQIIFSFSLIKIILRCEIVVSVIYVLSLILV